MPSKIKSKLLIITVLCATLTVLFVIAPITATFYAVIFLAISIALAIFACGNAKRVVNLQYKVSSFIGLAVMVFATLTAAIANFLAGGLQYIMAAACGLITVRCLTLLFAEEK